MSNSSGGVEVITYCMMTNHFHILIRVPDKQEPTDTQLLERMESLYGRKGVMVVLAREGMEKRDRIDADIRQSMIERMGDASAFMKEFKQRFSRWYNR